ncbi:MAG TPA: TIGR04283 family arsenosugar biosynthesis glycosyltransferase [Gemmatimonadales bacterium]|nr:TIGR04283 family arsenosugar biosynthesis glycosyltransferase [Gemmatimonadales bacterium]
MAYGPGLSVVVPTLDEAHALPGLLDDLALVPIRLEVVVADGGSSDATVETARARGARVVASERGRGLQLRAGAAAARGRVLAFLHADARLDRGTRAALAGLADLPDGVACAFALRIAASGRRYRMVEWGTALRSRLAGLPYGDQGLVLTRATYEAAGGFPALPLMEDVAMVRALKRVARVKLMGEPLLVSPRRWQRDGVARRTLGNWLLLAAYLAGVPPARLARAYRPHGARPHG